MALRIHLLDPAKLAGLKPGTYNDGGGLYLTVSDNSARWEFRGSLFNKPIKKSFGSLDERSIDEARDLAHAYRTALRDNKDPRLTTTIDGVNPQATPLFKTLAQEICDAATQGLKGTKSRASWQRTVNVDFAPLHDKQLHTITIDDVLAVLRPIWVGVPSRARNARQRLERIFDAAIAKGLRQNDPRNLAKLVFLKPLLPKQTRKGKIKGRHPSLPYALMPQFWVELRAIETLSSKALQFLILTAVRTNECLQAAGNQIAGERWVIPGKIMKNGLPADVPLTATARAIVDEMLAMNPAKEPLLFPGRAKPGVYGDKQGDRTLLKLIQETMGYDGTAKPRVTTHGFRATFRSWGQDETKHDGETLEYCLHHIEGEEAELAYKTGNMVAKRKAALLDWEAFVTSLERQQQAGGDKIIHLPIAA